MKRFSVPLSVILICHNEEKTIEKEIKAYYKTIIRKIPQTELIITEDGSKDNTRRIIYKLAKKIPLVLLVTPEKRGYARSLRMAIEQAKGEYVFYADAGGKHDPKDFWKLFKKRKEFDLISGYKKKRHDPWYRLFLAWGLNMLVNMYFNVSFKDIDSGFKLLNQKAKSITLNHDWILKNNISLEIVLDSAYQGCKTIEVPVKHFARKFGPSRGLPLKKIPSIVLDLLLLFPKIKAHVILLERIKRI